MTVPRIETHKGGPTACELMVWREGWQACAREARFVVVRPGYTGRGVERRQAACPTCASRYSASAAVPMPGERTLFESGSSRA